MITCKTFHPGKTGSLFCRAGIPLYWDKIFPCNCFSPPRRNKKVNSKISIEVHFKKSKIFRLSFYDSYDVNLWEKKSTNIFVEFHHFTKAATGGRCSTKKVFLKILKYAQENTCVGVSLRVFRSAILSKIGSNADIFLWILQNF